MSAPEALRLARELDACPTINYKKHAAELRRLVAQRDDLLAALRNLLAEGEFTDYPNTTQWYAVQAARAAIEKAEKV